MNRQVSSPDERGSRLLARWRERLDGVDGCVSAVLRTTAGVVAEQASERQHYAASTIKIAVLAALLDARARGEQSASETVVVTPSFPSQGGGWFTLRQADDQDDATWAHRGLPVDLLDLAEAMITVSSNIATDLVVDRIGLARVQAFLQRAGLSDQIVIQRLIGDDAVEQAGVTNLVTAGGLAALVAGLAGHRWLSPADADAAIAVLSRQTHLDGIPAGLPPGTWSASKGGWVPGVRHDVAFIRPEAAPPYVLAICTTSTIPDRTALALLADLSSITFEEWTTWHA